MSKSTPPSGSSPAGDERLADWLDGRMSPRELERFEAEMRVSKPLREKAEAYKKTAQAVKDAFSVAGPKVDVASKVLARLADPHGNRPGSTGGSGGSSVPRAGGVADAAPAGRVLAFPKSLPKPFLLSSLVACAMITLVLVLDRWQPASTTESAKAEAVEPSADARNLSDSAPGAGGEKVQLGDPRASVEGRSDADAGEAPLSEPKPAGGESSRFGNFSDQHREATRRMEEENRVVGGEANDLREDGNAPGDTNLRLGSDSAAGRTLPRGNADELAADAPGPATFGMLTPIQSAPPRTAVPTVRLRIPSETSRERLAPDGEGASAAKAKAAPDRDSPAAKAAGTGSLLTGALELDRALGNVQVFRLPSVPGEPVAPGESKDKFALRTGAAAPQAWLVEGPAADVQAFLASLSEAGRARGYEVVNGEVGIAELQAVDSSLPAVPGARFVPRPASPAATETAPGSGAGRASPGAANPGSPPAGPSSPGPGGPGTGAPTGGRRGTASPESGGTANPKAELGTVGGAERLPAAGGGGGGAMLVMPVRVVVVIESAK